MVLKMFFLLIGFGLAVSGGVTLVAYLNLLATGHGFTSYLMFISQRAELYLFISGIFIIWISIYLPVR